MANDNLDLGGNIRLTGFGETDGATMIIVKKMVGSFVRKVDSRDMGFQNLSLTLKRVHANPQSESSGKFELRANLIADKQHNAEVTHPNLLVAIDSVLKKIESGLQ